MLTTLESIAGEHRQYVIGFFERATNGIIMRTLSSPMISVPGEYPDIPARNCLKMICRVAHMAPRKPDHRVFFMRFISLAAQQLSIPR